MNGIQKKTALILLAGTLGAHAMQPDAPAHSVNKDAKAPLGLSQLGLCFLTGGAEALVAQAQTRTGKATLGILAASAVAATGYKLYQKYTSKPVASSKLADDIEEWEVALLDLLETRPQAATPEDESVVESLLAEVFQTKNPSLLLENVIFMNLWDANSREALEALCVKHASLTDQ